MSRPLLLPGLLLSLAGWALLASAPGAAAETLVLKSGSKVKASNVEIEDEVVRATLHVDGGTAVVSYRFDRLEPFHLVDLLERHWIVGHAAKDDGAAALRIAAVAQRYGLLDDAVVWLARAADIDPQLEPKRDAGLEAIRTTRVKGAFGVLEDLLRAKHPEKLVHAADEALAGELGLLLTPTEAMRMSALRGLAQQLIDRANGPAPATAQAPALDSPQPVAGPAAPGLGKELEGVLEAVDASVAKAVAARDKATDPGISNARARRLLETGAKSLLDARRRIRELPAPLPAPALDRAIAIDEALVTTWLDVAELYAEAGRLQTARRYLRSARLLDPDSERARDIELKLEAPPLEPPYEETALDWLYYPSGTSFFGSGCGFGSAYARYGYLGFPHRRHYGFRIGGHGHHHRHGSGHHGSRRVVGRRR